MPQRKPVFCTPQYQIKRMKTYFKTILINKPLTRLKRVNVNIDNSWDQYIMTGEIL